MIHDQWLSSIPLTWWPTPINTNSLQGYPLASKLFAKELANKVSLFQSQRANSVDRLGFGPSFDLSIKKSNFYRLFI